MTFEITTLYNNRDVSSADADTPEEALLAGQTMFDDALDAYPFQGSQRAISTKFTLDGNHVRTVIGQRP